MKLSTRGRYAVMAMADLAAHCSTRADGRPKPVSLADIAGRQQLSQAYLEQLFGKLRRCGIVRSVRGPGGGYLLGHAPTETSVADIIAAVDVSLRPGADETDVPAGPANNCIIRDLWVALGDQMQLFLRSVTLADLLARQRQNEDDPGKRGA